MKFVALIERAFKSLMPSPFSIALLLTAITFVLALTFTVSDLGLFDRGVELFDFWYKGMWEVKLLAFALQMMLMLVLGHVIALAKPVDWLIGRVTQYCTSTAKSAFIVTMLTLIMALFNWGLGLIFGAILARKVGEHANRNGNVLNYPLIGAAGYSGLMVWHGGISGTAPIMASEEGHIAGLMNGVVPESQLGMYPDAVSMNETVFGTMNLVTIVLLITLLPIFMYWLGNRFAKPTTLPKTQKIEEEEEAVEGADKLDASKVFALFFGVLFLVYALYIFYQGFQVKGFGAITPNFINLLLFGLGLTLHASVRNFLKAIDEAIGGASGILIQFPLYFGIMGIMKYSGLVENMSKFFADVSTEVTFPIYTFFSSGLVNIFVPSGGGQWAVQGPIVVQAAIDLGVGIPKAIMALSYGDQLTNMLQPFWALPLLGITGLKARSILPYTIALMGAGAAIFLTILFVF